MHCVKVSILGECGKIRTRKTRNTDFSRKYKTKIYKLENYKVDL